MPNGDGGFDFGNGIPSIGDDRTNALLSIIIAILNALIAALNFIIAVIAAIINFLVKAFQIFVRGLRHVLSDIVHGRFVHLYEDYLRLKAKLRRWVEDHLGWLLKLRKQFDEWFRNVVVPILKLIERLRAILAIFRIFHLKFAQRLDDLLGRLEAKIIKNTLALRGQMNKIVTIIDLVLDPGLLIRQNVLLASAARALKGLFAALGLGWGRELNAKEQAVQDQLKDHYNVAVMVERERQSKSAGPSVELLEREQRVRDALTEVTGLDPRRFG